MKETLSTSEKEVPKIKLGLQDKYDAEKKEEPHAKRLDENNIKDVADQLPEPVGYRLLVLPFTPKENCLLYTSPSPRDRQKSRMPSSA